MSKEDSTILGLFNIKTANQWVDEAKEMPVPNQLFSELWHEGELCFLFADTNLGKSILAVQIANSITKGQAIKGFNLNIKAQKVAYLDFELSAKQFENRYSKDFRNHYLFSENFYRANINPYQDKPKHLSDDEFLNYSIEELVKQKDFKFLIIDNITYLNSDMERARDALPLMKHLQALKAKYKLSILVLAHTPKRDMSKPITINDIQGSKMLINFTDSAFAIGRSYKDSSLRYIKQIKQRNTEEIYGSDNVVICQIIKESNFLEFRQIDFDREMNHLRTYSESEVAEIDKSIISLKEDKPSLSNREIAKQLKTNHTKVGRVLKRLEAQQLDLNM